MNRKLFSILIILSIATFVFAMAPNPPPPDPPPGDCTPGFWKQPHHFEYWEADFNPTTPYPYDAEIDTYLDALQGGKDTRVSRVLVAGLLNVANPDAPCD